MRCPVCPDASLVMTDRQSVEIDYCPQCRGVWLDRGELDKLIERAAMPDAQRSNTGHDRSQPRFEDSDQASARGHQSGGHPRRKKSWMSDIFD